MLYVLLHQRQRYFLIFVTFLIFLFIADLRKIATDARFDKTCGKLGTKKGTSVKFLNFFLAYRWSSWLIKWVIKADIVKPEVITWIKSIRAFWYVMNQYLAGSQEKNIWENSLITCHLRHEVWVTHWRMENLLNSFHLCHWAPKYLLHNITESVCNM